MCDQVRNKWRVESCVAPLCLVESVRVNIGQAYRSNLLGSTIDYLNLPSLLSEGLCEIISASSIRLGEVLITKQLRTSLLSCLSGSLYLLIGLVLVGVAALAKSE